MKRRVTVKARLWIVLIVAFLLCGAIARLLYVSLSHNVDGMNLKEFAESRNKTKRTLYASRGTIYDSDGEVLALSVNSYTLIAYLDEKRTDDPNNPQHVVDKAYTAQVLAPVLGTDESTLLGILSKDAYQVEFGTYGKDLTETVKKKIEDLELPGIDFVPGTQRYYKMGDFASYIIGYAKTNDAGEIAGELGIESYYDNELSGTDGYEEYQRDAYGYQLPNAPSYTKKAESGSDIYLTIDSNIQLITENAMDKLENNYKYDWAIMTIVDAKTGAIVASATSPSYNPNNLNTLESYLNPLVSYTYEPGSTMKTFSWAASMENGFYDGEKTFKSGSIDVADVTISDANKTGWGVISYDTGYAYSSNVGATNLALKLGRDKLYEFYDNLGFGKQTGIELSGEVAGDISMKYKSEIATAAFGQGITITPIQMVQALTSLTNNGEMLRPYIVDKIVDSKGNETYSGKRTIVKQTMSDDTATKMRGLMHKVNYEGLSKIWQPKTVSMGIKTGTAQIASPKGGYLDGKYDVIYSLAGIFPEENPRYILYTAVSKIIASQKNYADVVVEAVDAIATYANISEVESTVDENSIYITENYLSKKAYDVNEQLSNQGYNVVIIGNGDYIINQYPSAGSKIVKGAKVFLVTNGNEIIVPDFTGWSLSEVKTYCQLSNIGIVYEGFGYVSGQSIAAGTTFDASTSLQVNLITKSAIVVEPSVDAETENTSEENTETEKKEE